ncbi:MAG: hypothetical protein RLZZ545_1000 [Actinomycetota bacterium]
MSPRILLFEEPERFVVGTVGQPGERTFFIQAKDRTRLISVSLEKGQVQALAERLVYMVKEIRQSDPTIVINKLPRDDSPLETPIEEEFRVGIIGLAFDASRSLIQIDFQAIAEGNSTEPEFIDVDDLSSDQDIVRVLITPSEAEKFSKRCVSVVNAGRAPCPFCGGPIDPGGHLCPRANGYRR